MFGEWPWIFVSSFILKVTQILWFSGCKRDESLIPPGRTPHGPDKFPFSFPPESDDTHARIYTKVVDILQDAQRSTDINHEHIVDKVIDIYTKLITSIVWFGGEIETLNPKPFPLSSQSWI